MNSPEARRMAFVHSLVKTRTGENRGWCAPAELGEAAPHYISFAIPLTDDRSFFDRYLCETITVAEGERRVEIHELRRIGDDTFVLRQGETDFWFAVRPSSRHEYRLPYVGVLEHDDFHRLFVEIEPQDPGQLDRLYEERNTTIIGCEPFTHYQNIDRFVKSHTALIR